MSYLVLARKYRPQTFDDVVGQSPIATTLKNVLTKDRVAHAYLFAGPRGVGKTSMARIIAKALNCEKGISTESCNQCSICRSIAVGEDVDVIELDAASNRGIDEIRDIRENVRYSPSRARFKIYIIDEVHMLTREAFNALLKTLEEPPPHVKFILATTQPERIPATILSRCQRFDFRRLTLDHIVKRLEHICKEENTPANREVLFEIARHAEGGMRDSISLLDQILSFCEGAPGLDALQQMLGTVPWLNIADLVDFLLAKDHPAILRTVDELYSRGKDPAEFLSQLLQYFRGLMVLGSCPDDASLVEESPEKLKRMKKQAEDLRLDHCLYAFSVLSHTMKILRQMGEGRLLLEMALMKLSRMKEVMTLEELADTLQSSEGNCAPTSSAAPREKTPPNCFSPGNCAPEGSSDNEKGENSVQDVARVEAPSGSQPEGWEAMLDQVTRTKISLGKFLGKGALGRVENSRLIIHLPPGSGFHKDMFEDPQNLQILEHAARKVWKRSLRIVFEEREGEKVRAEGKKAGRERADQSEQLERAMQMFDGRIVGKEKKPK